MEGEVLAVLVDWCYTGRLVLSLDSVADVLAAADLLLLDWVTQRCQEFLTAALQPDILVQCGRLAKLYRLPGLQRAVVATWESQVRPAQAVLVLRPCHPSYDQVTALW